MMTCAYETQVVKYVIDFVTCAYETQGVKYVIDFGTHKELQFDSQSGWEILKRGPISKAGVCDRNVVWIFLYGSMCCIDGYVVWIFLYGSMCCIDG